MRGVGVDITHIQRVAASYRRFGDRFLARAFHPAEVARFKALLGAPTPAGTADATPEAAATAFLASRWAVKEAVHKALQGRHRLLFPEMEVCKVAAGACGVQGGGALLNAVLRQQLAAGGTNETQGSRWREFEEGGQEQETVPWQRSDDKSQASAPSGAVVPSVRFHGAAGVTMREWLGVQRPQHEIPYPFVSLSHDGQYAAAFVVLVAPPPLA